MNVLAVSIGALLGMAVLLWTGLGLPQRGGLAAILFVTVGAGLPALAARARTRAETPVLRNLALIAAKEELFRASHILDRDGDGRGEYGPLYGLYRTRPPLIHDSLAAATEYGYRYYVILGKTIDENESSYFAYAVPESYGVTGRRAMYVDETGIIRVGDAGSAGVVTREFGQSWAQVDAGIDF